MIITIDEKKNIQQKPAPFYDKNLKNQESRNKKEISSNRTSI